MANRTKSGVTPGGRTYVSHKTKTGQVTKIARPGSTVGSYAKYSGDQRLPSVKTKSEKRLYADGRLVKKGPTKALKKK